MNGINLSVEWYRQYLVATHLPSLFYVPEYVVPEQEAALMREVLATKAKWVQLSGRRLQNLGGVVHAKGLIPAPLPSWLQPLLTRLAAEGGSGGLYGGKPPNHVLVNSYIPGEGIMPHEDGPAYHPVVAILSLGAPAVLRFRRKPRPEGDLAMAAEGAAAMEDGGGCGGLPAANIRDASSGHSDQQLHPPPQQLQPQPQPLQLHGQQQQQQQQQDQEQLSAAEGGSPSVAATTEAAAAAGTEGASAAPAKVTPAPTNGHHIKKDPYGPHHPSNCDRHHDGDCSCRSSYSASLLLQPRSLVVFRDEAFTDCLHSIEEVSEELLDESVANLDMYGLSTGTTLPRGGERISLTVRRVARVMPSILRR